MKKLFAVISAAVLLLLCACNPTGSGESLSVEDMTLYCGESREIVVEGAKESVEYTFEGHNIAVEDGVVTALVAHSETQVTATSGGARTTFVVRVTYDTLGEHATSGENAPFERVDSNTLIRTDKAYGESFYYLAGAPLVGESYIVTGTMDLTDLSEGAAAYILLRESAEKAIVFSVEMMGTAEHAIYACTQSGEQETRELIRTRNGSRVNFLVIFDEGTAHLFIDDAYCGRAALELSAPHFGFGSENATLRLTRLNASYDEHTISSFLTKARAPFGAHATGGAESLPSMFREQSEGVFTKRSYQYSQTFYYQDGLPMYGYAFSVSGKLAMIDPDQSGQAVLLLAKGDGEMIRFVLEYINNSYHIFTDIRTGFAFSGYRSVAIVGSEINFEVVYADNVATLYLDGNYVCSTYNNLGQAHFGFGGEKSKMTVSELHGRFDVVTG